MEFLKFEKVYIYYGARSEKHQKVYLHMFVYMNELHSFRSRKRRIHVLRYFGFFGDTENTELPEQKASAKAIDTSVYCLTALVRHCSWFGVW